MNKVYSGTNVNIEFIGTAAPSKESATYNAKLDAEYRGNEYGAKLGTNTLAAKITLVGDSFKIGDVIYITGYNPIMISSAYDGSSTRPTGDIEKYIITGTKKEDYNVGSYTFTKSYETIYLSRANSSGTGLGRIVIKRK